MKKIFTLLTALVILSVLNLTAQTERYIDEIFDEVTVDAGVVYGVNATILFIPAVGEAVPQDLLMDVYQPVGDTETDRALVLVFHTGNFLPNLTNGQISGTRQDSGIVEICKQLARKGYVVASCDYRLGWNPLADTQPIRALGLIQAAYRGIQDGKTATRFFRKDAVDNGNNYGIDPSKIAAWGNGTGGYLTLGLASLDQYIKIPVTTHGPAKFVLDLNQDGVPETPMLVEAFHGDVEGKILTVAPADGFGLMAGDTTNYPNHVNYNDGTSIPSHIDLCINTGGALGDISWLDENTAPIITVQSAFDIFAPYDDAVLVVPTTNDPIVRVQGGKFIHSTMQDLGIHDVFNNATFDDVATQAAMDNSATAMHDYQEALYPFVNPPNSLGIDEGVVVEWWNPNALSPPILPDFPNGLPWNMVPHPSGGTFHSQGLITNENMSAAKAKANIALVMAYANPRMCVALDLPCARLFSGIEDVILDASIIDVYPNPTTSRITVNADERMIEKIGIYGFDGRLQRETIVNSNIITISNLNLATGIYFVKANLKEGIVIKKIIVE